MNPNRVTDERVEAAMKACHLHLPDNVTRNVIKRNYINGEAKRQAALGYEIWHLLIKHLDKSCRGIERNLPSWF